MNYLLDTHVCIWAIAEPIKLSSKVRDLLQDSENSFWVSQISLFEIAIKIKIGKLPEFKTTLSEFIKIIFVSGYEILPVKNEHFETYNTINFDEAHRDPFDRYILASAYFESMAIITKDEKFQLYKSEFEIIW